MRLHSKPIEPEAKPAATINKRPKRGEWLFVFAFLALHWILGWTSWMNKATTYDEIAYITAGAVQWQTGDHRMTPMNAPLPHLWAGLPFAIEPIELREYPGYAWNRSLVYFFGWDTFYESGNDAQHLLRLSRGMMGLASAGLCLLVWWWSRKLWGPIGGGLSLAAATLSPTLLAHGFLVTSDAMMALFLSASCFFFWRCLHSLTWGNLIGCALATTALFSTKISAPIFLFMAAGMLGVRLAWGPSMEIALKSPKRTESKLSIFGWTVAVAVFSGLVFYFSIWAMHGFRYEMLNVALTPDSTPLESWESITEKLSAPLAALVDFARSFKLMPEAYIYGYAIMFGLLDKRSGFLAGEYSQDGWVEFFRWHSCGRRPWVY